MIKKLEDKLLCNKNYKKLLQSKNPEGNQWLDKENLWWIKDNL